MTWLEFLAGSHPPNIVLLAVLGAADGVGNIWRRSPRPARWLP